MIHARNIIKFSNMKSVYYIQYEVRPAPANNAFATVGGAYVNCLIAADSEAQALNAAQRSFNENLWEVVGIEEGPNNVARSVYIDDAEWLSYFDEALASGECYVFNQWPPEPQEGDVVH